MENSNQGRTPFGERLLRARKHRGFTQKQVEMHVGIAQSNLAELELKGTGSSFTVSLALLYGVNPVWLALGKGPVSGGRPFPDWLEGLSESELRSVEEFVQSVVAGRRRGQARRPPIDAVDSPESTGKREAHKRPASKGK
jgi:transcriptional regulator with XRE-family HTH domain